MAIAYALPEDLDYLSGKDHLGREIIEEKIDRHEFIVAYQDDQQVGFLRYNYFLDDMPFMNQLWVQEDLRRRGFGTQLISFWEEEMGKLGYEAVLTSTQSPNERAQRLYRRLGYKDSGCLIMCGEPLEIVLLKSLSEET